jgi:hypothetical protein
MVQPQTLTTIFDYAKGAWAALGPLIGVLVGAWLARSSDRKKWIKDNRTQECRELLAAVSHAATVILDVGMLGGPTPNERGKAYLESMKVFKSRLFIAKEVEEYKLLDSWAHAVNDFTKSGDRHKFDDSFEVIIERLVEMATK